MELIITNFILKEESDEKYSQYNADPWYYVISIPKK